jgi:FdhD protein
MLFKAAIMGVPIVGSRTSPTNLALAVAERLNITVCGYLRQGSMNVYTHPRRIQNSDVRSQTVSVTNHLTSDV